MVDLLGTQCVPIFCGHTINIQQCLPRNIMAGHPLRNKGLIAGLIKGNQWLISPY